MPLESGDLVLLILQEVTRGKDMLPCFQDRPKFKIMASSALTEIRLALSWVKALVVLPNRGIIKNSPRRMCTKLHI
jgi:hypothetical protein